VTFISPPDDRPWNFLTDTAVDLVPQLAIVLASTLSGFDAATARWNIVIQVSYRRGSGGQVRFKVLSTRGRGRGITVP
jgi:hypothetical protein